MADVFTFTTSGATLALIAERLAVYFIVPRFKDRRPIQEGSTSGDKDPAFWRAEFRQAIDEKLDQRIMPLLEKQTEILESVARTQEGMATMVEQLSDRKRRR